MICPDLSQDGPVMYSTSLCIPYPNPSSATSATSCAVRARASIVPAFVNVVPSISVVEAIPNIFNRISTSCVPNYRQETVMHQARSYNNNRLSFPRFGTFQTYFLNNHSINHIEKKNRVIPM